MACEKGWEWERALAALENVRDHHVKPCMRRRTPMGAHVIDIQSAAGLFRF